MMNIAPRILVVDDEQLITAAIRELMRPLGFGVDCCTSAEEAQPLLMTNVYDLVICDIVMPGRSGIQLLADLKNARVKLPRFVFISGYFNAEIFERANRLGAVDVITKPFNFEDLRDRIARLLRPSDDLIDEVSRIVREITGVQLGKERRQLVETRLMRRMREIGMTNVEDYARFFERHRATEIDHLVSHLTTHHTFFFREPTHFDYLCDRVFPDALKNGREIAIWSAACSTGEEVYSIVVTYLEFLRQHAVPSNSAPTIRVLGTDVDEASVARAKNGIYQADKVAALRPELVNRYFDIGKGELSGLFRIKDEVHRLCTFDRRNLIANPNGKHQFDAIFVRNVLIYFDQPTIDRITDQLHGCLKDTGFLILGHSESISGSNTRYRSLGNSIYAKTAANNRSQDTPLSRTSADTEHARGKAERGKLVPATSGALERPVTPDGTIAYQPRPNSNDLILIGASTGGVDAIRSVLGPFPGNCPPVLIVQHIPAHFSTAFANRLNSICQIRVKEAEDGEFAAAGCAYIAPGGMQMGVSRSGKRLRIRVTADAPVNRHRPSVDYLFRDVARFAEHFNIAATILTGMGADGAQGLLELRHLGAYTIAQDEATSVVFGMPQAAQQTGAALTILPLQDIARALFAGLRSRKLTAA